MKLTRLQLTIIVVIGIILFFIFAALFGFLPGLKKAGQQKIKISFWDTRPNSVWQSIFVNLAQKNVEVDYTQKEAQSYIDTVVSAQAAGKGPDVWILPVDSFIQHADKTTPAPSSIFSVRDIQSAFPDIAKLFTREPNTVWAVPATIDPMVLYWNKDLFNTAGVAQPPKTWNEFSKANIQLTSHGPGTSIVTAGTALGLASNIAYAPDIVSLLMMQTGNTIVDVENLTAVFNQAQQIGNVSIVPAHSIMRFFSDFANPEKISYSWNASFPEAKDAFIGGRVAMFLGFASDYEDIKQRNPHLNFGVEIVPQIDGAKTRLTYARVNLFVAARTSKDPLGAWRFINTISQPQYALETAKKQNTIAPLRLPATTYEEAHLQTFADSILIATTWLKPDPNQVATILREMIELIHSNDALITDAVRGANDKLQLLLRDKQNVYRDL